jgi:hypothetical protein
MYIGTFLNVYLKLFYYKKNTVNIDEKKIS